MRALEYRDVATLIARAHAADERAEALRANVAYYAANPARESTRARMQILLAALKLELSRRDQVQE